jgi:pyruvate ferredoxin oxidoreductase gamma subunit
MKTASRIVGTTAFRQGYHAQDSPVYGAERRGAPMVAFTRFDSHPILERGLVASPDLVVIADASLLDDPLVRPLQGLSHNGSILINSTGQYESLPSVSCDFTGIALEHAGTTSALSVALAAAAAQSAGLDLKYVEAAVHAELEDLKFSSRQIDKNIKLAHVSFHENVQTHSDILRRPGAVADVGE